MKGRWTITAGFLFGIVFLTLIIPNVWVSSAHNLLAKNISETQSAHNGFDFLDFSSTDNLSLVGDYDLIDSKLRLTSAEEWQGGAAWYVEKQYIKDGFETTFQFKFTNLGNLADWEPGADGIAFVIQNVSDVALGGEGSELGYGGLSNNLAVEFDTWYDWWINEPNNNHISVQTGGTRVNHADQVYSLGVATDIPNMSDGEVHMATIRYVPGSLTVYLDNLSEPVLEVPVDIEDKLNLDNGAAWVGFTSATGAAWEDHDLLSWLFSTGLPLTCNDPVYPGVEHCTKGAIQVLRIDPTQVGVETVLPEGYAAGSTEKSECKDVNIPNFSTGPGCHIGGKYPTETVGQMATRYLEDEDYNVVAIFNADLFSFPENDHGPEGLTVKNGVRFDGLGYDDMDQNGVNRPSLSIKRNDEIRIGKVTDIDELPISGDLNSPHKDEYWNSVGGLPVLVKNGVSVVDQECSTSACGVDGGNERARTAVGKTDVGQLIVVVIPEENGVTLNELAEEMIMLGSIEAINLDGGGSSQLWYNGGYLIPEGGNVRPVAEGLLVYSEKPSTDLLLDTRVYLFRNDFFQQIFRILHEFLKLQIEVIWPGSDVNLVLIQPDGTILPLNDSSVTYTKTGNYISVTVQNPQPGDWQLEVEAVDMPPEGEDVQITVLAANLENVDITSPVTRWTTDGIPGENGWFVSDVTVNLTTTDDLSGVAATLYSVDDGNLIEGTSIILSEEGIHNVQFHSIDNDDNVEGTQTITVRVDKTVPTLTVPDGITVEGNTTSGANVTLPAATATDIVDPSPEVSCDHTSGFFPLDITTITCTATDAAGNSSSSSFEVEVVDTTPPNLTCPANINEIVGQSISLGSPKVVDVVDSYPTIANDAPGSFVPGTTTVTWTATDDSGNIASCLQTVKLTYNFDGFFAPVDNLPVLNAAKAGRAIPVKFSLDGDWGLDILAEDFPVSQHLNCDTSASVDDIEETVNAGNSSLSYDADSDQYNYIWKTDKEWANTCRQLVMRLDDGTDHIAKFEFK